MKILQLVKYYFPSKGGMESVVQDIVESIDSLGPSNNSFVVYANSHVPLFTSLLEQKGNILSIKERTLFLLRSQPLNLSYPKLAKLIADSDIVHHHYPFPNMEIALLRKRKLLKDKKLIITWHANIENSRWSFIGKFYNPLIVELLSMCDAVIVTSPQLLENSKILQGFKDKVKVIPLSFNSSLYKLNQPKSFPVNRRFKLLFVGKLREYKGLKYLIESIKDIDVELSIIGSGEMLNSLREQARRLSIEEKVAFFTDLSDEELKQKYMESDLFVLPSINEAEAFGVVQLEAMANGLPVINTSLKSGVPFVSLDGETGLTVRPKSSEQLREAIVSILSNKEKYECFSVNALERVKLFSREKLAKSYLDIYSS